MQPAVVLRIGLILLGGVSTCVHAEPGKLPVPVLLVMPASQHIEISNGGLIGAWISSSLNKASAQRAERFRTMLADPDFVPHARRIFGCFALAGPCEAPMAFVDPEEFAAAVRTSETQTGFVIEFMPEQTPEQMLLRATARHVKRANDVGGTPIKVGIGYSAVYTTRAPAELIAGAKSAPKALEAWWAEGEPRRVSAEAHRGVVELNELFTLLLREGREYGPMPEAWLALPTLEPPTADNARFACKKRLCSSLHIVEDLGDSVVLVGINGRMAGWLNAAAAAREVNLFAMASSGIVWH